MTRVDGLADSAAEAARLASDGDDPSLDLEADAAWERLAEAAELDGRCLVRRCPTPAPEHSYCPEHRPV